MNRNFGLDFFKFAYSWLVVLFHFYSETSEHFISGRFAVDFFLIVSGVFFIQEYERSLLPNGSLKLTPSGYFKKRFSRFFPWALAGFVLTVFVSRIILNPISSFEKALDYFSSDIWEILLLKMNGLNNNNGLVNGPAWTLSSILIVQFIMWAFLYFYKDRFLELILPISLLVGFGMWRHIETASVKLWIGFTTFGTFRSWLLIGCSVYCFRLAKALKKISFSKVGQWILTITEVIIHAFSVWVIMTKTSRYYQYTVILGLIVAVAISLSGHSYLTRILNRIKFCGLLGQLSLSVYLVHYSVILVYSHLYQNPYVRYSHKYSFVLVVLVGSVVFHFAVKYILKLTGRIKSWFSGIILNKNTENN